MLIATWNVNSIAVRLSQVLDWIESRRPDVLCLQEIKCTDERFPSDPFRGAGYHVATFGQPTYNGVAILSREPLSEIERGFAGDDEDAPRRLLAASAGPVRVINVYVPNGQAVGTEKYAFKLKWLDRLRRHFNERYDPRQQLILCGDFNVAPEDRDVHDPKLWAGRIMCSARERSALGRVREWGLSDVFRLHHEESGLYSWWDYRGGSYRRNEGLRIDHLWATASLAARCTRAEIDSAPRALERPSDHAPVRAHFEV
jgi:exodeoxyribonuclease-3